MNRHHIRFTGSWKALLSPDAMYAKLADVGAYPTWWTGFRSVRQTGEHACVVVIQSVLLYSLTARMTAVVADPAERVLKAAVDGDIAGTVGWTVEPGKPHGSVAHFTEHVTVQKAAVRRRMPIARPVFHINHALAMRSGQRALTALAHQSA
ncbi:SRPBCC family protein [Streptomyces sp. NPDC050448]|uniref:SRPBCC family protein n=1 Tax=Streptomyces sp. NPDC050448 TaxID=3155404 RepID=UPI003429FFB5